MKTLRNILLTGIMGIVILIQGCEESGINNPKEDNGILPARFKVDIPGSLSSDAIVKSALKSASETDTLTGNEIYAHLNTFIAAGEGASEIVQDIIFAIALYDIDEPVSLSFQSDDDNRVKNLVVTEVAEYSDRIWEFMLTITDAESESEPDEGKALQIFWNRNPIEGIALLKPYNIDRKHDSEWLDAIFRIEYSEAGTDEYDTYMIVEITGIPMPDPRIEPFALKSLKKCPT